MSGPGSLPPLSRRSAKPRVPSAQDIDLSQVLANLLNESSDESLDQRRVYMLKCQQAQLERQLLILVESVSQRRELLSAVADCVDQVLALCRQSIAQDIRGPTVPVQRAQLTAIVDRCRILQGTLNKEVDDLLNDRYYSSNLVPNRFLTSRKDVKLRDLVVSSKGLAFLNLGRTRQLEGDLLKLYKLLSSLSNVSALIWETSLVPSETQRRYQSLISSSLSLLRSVSKDVSELSLLIPSFPSTSSTDASRPKSQESASAAASTDSVCSDLQSLSLREDVRSYLKEVRTAEARGAIEAKLKAYKHEVDVLVAEQKVLQEELAERQVMLANHADSVNQLVDGLRAGYQTFRNDFRDSVCTPLEEILKAYDDMEESPDNRSLRDFLEKCKEHFPAVRTSLFHIGKEMASGDEAIDPLFREFRKVLLQRFQQQRKP